MLRGQGESVSLKTLHATPSITCFSCIHPNNPDCRSNRPCHQWWSAMPFLWGYRCDNGDLAPFLCQRRIFGISWISYTCAGPVGGPFSEHSSKNRARRKGSNISLAYDDIREKVCQFHFFIENIICKIWWTWRYIVPTLFNIQFFIDALLHRW